MLMNVRLGLIPLPISTSSSTSADANSCQSFPFPSRRNYPLKRSSFRADCLDQLCLGAPDLKHCTSLWVRTFLFLFSVSYLLNSSLLSSSQPSDEPSVMKFRVIAVLTLMNQGLFIWNPSTGFQFQLLLWVSTFSQPIMDKGTPSCWSISVDRLLVLVIVMPPLVERIISLWPIAFRAGISRC